MKKSEWVVLGVAATVGVGVALHHRPVMRDRYSSLEDCLTDWGVGSGHCTRDEAGQGSGSSSSSGGGGGGGGGGYVSRGLYGGTGGTGGTWYGPTYEQGDRPVTRQQGLSIGRDTVARSGFGRTGARVSGGG